MQIELDQDEVDLIVEVLRIQIDQASQAQIQNPSDPDLALFVHATRQIQALQELLKKFQPPIVPE